MPGGHVASSSQILQVNVISARDLAPVSKSMKTFALAWIQPDRRLRTRVDPTGHTNPTWNDKLVFRLDHLDYTSSSITIEIYATSSRGADVLVGSVALLVSSLFAAPFHKMRFLALQIRRPSGRAQGVLNVGVSLLEGTRRSLDLSSVGYSDLIPDPKSNKDNHHRNIMISKSSYNNKIQLRHSKSERSMNNEFAGNKGFVMAGSLCSDVGPSPSVVAAAIAMGLYPTVAVESINDHDRTAGSSILNDWREEDDSVEGLKTKIERWRSEIHPIYEKQIINNNINYGRSSYRRNNEPKSKRSEHKRAGSGGGLFSCFGTAYGCEFSISCGGGSRRTTKKLDSGGDNSHLSLSELTYNDPYV